MRRLLRSLVASVGALGLATATLSAGSSACPDAASAVAAEAPLQHEDCGGATPPAAPAEHEHHLDCGMLANCAGIALVDVVVAVVPVESDVPDARIPFDEPALEGTDRTPLAPPPRA